MDGEGLVIPFQGSILSCFDPLASCFGSSLFSVRVTMEAVALVPREGATGAQLFQELARNFKLSDTVRDALVAAQLDNLDEFRFLFDNEAKVEPWIGKLALGDEKVLQGARLRRAWSAVRLFYQQAEQDRSKVAIADLDSMLAESELRDAKVAFWRRYRQRYPAELHPADATLSRVARELTKRMLCVFNVWKVKSLQFQLHTTNRKRKLGENLFTEDQEEAEPVSQDWETYMDRLQILLVAYAMAGTEAIPQAPGAAVTSDAALGADSSQFVMVPLDVVMSYWYRAKRTSSVLPMARRLEWVQTRDVAERAEWVSRFRESSASLGAIIKEVMVARDAHWIAHLSASPTVELPSAGSTTPVVKTQQISQFTLGKSVNGRSVAKTMKDGTRLCAAFQQGQCKQKGTCPQGQHRCGVVTKKERVRGSTGPRWRWGDFTRVRQTSSPMYGRFDGWPQCTFDQSLLVLWMVSADCRLAPGSESRLIQSTKATILEAPIARRLFHCSSAGLLYKEPCTRNSESLSGWETGSQTSEV